MKRTETMIEHINTAKVWQSGAQKTKVQMSFGVCVYRAAGGVLMSDMERKAMW